jgi:hypothetical protein
MVFGPVLSATFVQPWAPGRGTVPTSESRTPAAPRPDPNTVTVDEAQVQRFKIEPVQLRSFREGKTNGLLLSRWAVVGRADQAQSAQGAMIEAVVVIAILAALSWLAPVLLLGLPVMERPTAKNTAPAARANRPTGRTK